ncbi:MAG TPA: acyltransferase, partial [Phormidium sp.]
ISHDVNIFDNQTHPFNPVERHKQYIHILQEGFPKNIDLGGEKVLIEDDVWIGCGAILLKGVSIGKCSIVGAGSVVTKDIPPWTFAAGNPARIIRDISKECGCTMMNEVEDN